MRKITPDQSPLSPQSHNSIFRLVVRNFYTEADQVGWNRCGTLGATYLFLLFQCRIAELHLSPSIQQNRQLERDTFQWRTAVSEHASHCLSHEQTEIRAILLIVFFFINSMRNDLPARTKQLACYFCCSADKWCSFASHPHRFPACRITSTPARVRQSIWAIRGGQLR